MEDIMKEEVKLSNRADEIAQETIKYFQQMKSQTKRNKAQERANERAEERMRTSAVPNGVIAAFTREQKNRWSLVGKNVHVLRSELNKIVKVNATKIKRPDIGLSKRDIEAFPYTNVMGRAELEMIHADLIRHNILSSRRPVYGQAKEIALNRIYNDRYIDKTLRERTKKIANASKFKKVDSKYKKHIRTKLANQSKFLEDIILRTTEYQKPSKNARIKLVNIDRYDKKVVVSVDIPKFQKNDRLTVIDATTFVYEIQMVIPSNETVADLEDAVEHYMEAFRKAGYAINMMKLYFRSSDDDSNGRVFEVSPGIEYTNVRTINSNKYNSYLNYSPSERKTIFNIEQLIEDVKNGKYLKNNKGSAGSDVMGEEAEIIPNVFRFLIHELRVYCNGSTDSKYFDVKKIEPTTNKSCGYDAICDILQQKGLPRLANNDININMFQNIEEVKKFIDTPQGKNIVIVHDIIQMIDVRGALDEGKVSISTIYNPITNMPIQAVKLADFMAIHDQKDMHKYMAIYYPKKATFKDAVSAPATFTDAKYCLIYNADKKHIFVGNGCPPKVRDDLYIDLTSKILSGRITPSSDDCSDAVIPKTRGKTAPKPKPQPKPQPKKIVNNVLSDIQAEYKMLGKQPNQMNTEYLFFDYETVTDFSCKCVNRPYSLAILHLTEDDLTKIVEIDKIDPNIFNNVRNKYFKNVKIAKPTEQQQDILDIFKKSTIFIGYDCTQQFYKYIVKHSPSTNFVLIGFNNSNYDNYILYRDLLENCGDAQISAPLIANGRILNFKLNGRHHPFDLRNFLTALGSLKNICKAYNLQNLKKMDCISFEYMQQLYIDGELQQYLDDPKKSMQLRMYNTFDVLSIAYIFKTWRDVLRKIEGFKSIIMTPKDAQLSTDEQQNAMKIELGEQAQKLSLPHINRMREEYDEIQKSIYNRLLADEKIYCKYRKQFTDYMTLGQLTMTRSEAALELKKIELPKFVPDRKTYVDRTNKKDYKLDKKCSTHRIEKLSEMEFTTLKQILYNWKHLNFRNPEESKQVLTNYLNGFHITTNDNGETEYHQHVYYNYIGAMKKQEHGRQKPYRYQSLGSLLREIRGTVNKSYIDVDMNNAVCRILQQYCLKKGYPCTQLENNIVHNEKYLAELVLAHHFKGTPCEQRTAAKQMRIQIIFGGKKRLSPVQWYNDLAAEMEIIHKSMQADPENQELIKLIVNKKKCDAFFKANGFYHASKYTTHYLKYQSSDNILGSLVANIVFKIENELLMKCMKFIHNEESSILCYDGFMIKNKIPAEMGYKNMDDFIDALEEYIQHETGYSVSYKVKSGETIDLTNMPTFETPIPMTREELFQFYIDLAKSRVAGRCQVFGSPRKTKCRIFSMDACSLYPYICCIANNYFPSGDMSIGKIVDDILPPNIDDKIRFYSVKCVHQSHLPIKILAQKGSFNDWNAPVVRGTQDDGCMLLSNIMVNYLIENNCKIEFGDKYYEFSEKVKNTDIFGWMLPLMKLKNEQDMYKKTKDPIYNEVERGAYKLIMNIITGKFNQSVNNTKREIITCAAEWLKLADATTSINAVTFIGNKLHVSYTEDLTKKMDGAKPLFIGALIYEYSRLYMHEHVYSKAWSNMDNLDMYYTDTDSCKMGPVSYQNWVKYASTTMVPHWEEVEQYDERYKTATLYMSGQKVFGSFEDEYAAWVKPHYEVWAKSHPPAPTSTSKKSIGEAHFINEMIFASDATFWEKYPSYWAGKKRYASVDADKNVGMKTKLGGCKTDCNVIMNFLNLTTAQMEILEPHHRDMYKSICNYDEEADIYLYAPHKMAELLSMRNTDIVGEAGNAYAVNDFLSAIFSKFSTTHSINMNYEKFFDNLMLPVNIELTPHMLTQLSSRHRDMIRSTFSLNTLGNFVIDKHKMNNFFEDFHELALDNLNIDPSSSESYTANAEKFITALYNLCIDFNLVTMSHMSFVELLRHYNKMDVLTHSMTKIYNNTAKCSGVANNKIATTNEKYKSSCYTVASLHSVKQFNGLSDINEYISADYDTTYFDNKFLLFIE